MMQFVVRQVRLWASWALVLGVTACGGGGGGSGPSASDPGTVTNDPETVASEWVHVANEGDDFSVTQPQWARFGASGQWTRLYVSGSVTCSTAFFGSDPAPGELKSCQVQVDTSVPVASGEYRWSDQTTWGGVIPGAGADVVIPVGRTVVLDTNTAALGTLRIEGTLRFAQDRDIQLTARAVRVSGALRIGSSSAPYTRRAVITLNGVPQAVNDGASRGLVVENGALQIYASAPQPAWTKLNAHATAGTTELTLARSTDWRAGQSIVLAPTDFYGRDESQQLTVAGATGSQVTTAAGIASFRWGRLQYMGRTGMGLSPDPDYVPLTPTTPTVLDERAVVANLSRNVVIQSPDDRYWNDNGFGAHVMIMGLGSRVVVDGVEFRRVGQAGVLGRYPFHWHMLSYEPSTGALIGDAVGHVLRNSAIWNSSNRCVVVHGTNGVQVINNVCFNVRGHALFLEDGSERRNRFERNVALRMRAPPSGVRLQVHEGEGFQNGPSGFWLTNPDNVVVNNIAGDAAGNGFWLSYRHTPLGLSARVPVFPDRLPHGEFSQNTAHSNRGPGLLLDWVAVDAAGNLTTNRYTPTFDGSDNTALENQARFTLSRITSYKNLDGAYRNRSQRPSYLEWVTADNVGTHFAGSGDFGLIAQGLMVGYSLNNRTPYPDGAGVERPVAFATYHSTFNLQDNTVVNFPAVAGQAGGAFKTNDYYLVPVDKGLARNTNNRLVASHAGYREPSPNIDSSSTAAVPLAGALWDAHGYWGPAGNFWVYDLPFFTAGAQCVSVEPTGRNGVSCNGQYYGVHRLQTNFDDSMYAFSSPIEAVRQDANGVEIGRWSWSGGTSSVDHFQHFAARQGGRYVLRFPNRPLPVRVAFSVSNAYRAGDAMLLAVSFDGSRTAAGYIVSGNTANRATVNAPSYTRYFLQAGSLAEVAASGGDRIWQDRTRNLVWMKVQGGLPYPNLSSLVPDGDEALYRPLNVVLTAQ